MADSGRIMRHLMQAVIIGLLLFFLISWIYPSNWNWSVISIDHLLPYALILFAVISITTLIPAIGSAIYKAVTNLLLNIQQNLALMPKSIKSILWILIPGALLYAIKTNCYIYGDGHLILGHISRDNIISKTAYGFSLLVKFAYSTMDLGKLMEPSDIMAVISIICGIVFMNFLYRILTLLIEDNGFKLIIYFACASSAIVVLFTGYAETYSILTAWLAVYTFCAIKYTRGEFRSLPLFLIFLIGVFWHIWFIAFLPSLMFLLNKRFRIIPGSIIPALAGLFVIGVYIGGRLVTRNGIPATLPIFNNTDTSYSIISIQHLLDFFNILIFTGPILILLAIVLLIASTGKEKTDEIKMLLYLAVPAIIISFFIDPALGAARDWDLLSIFALPAILLAAAIMAKNAGEKANYKFLLVPILMIGIIHTGIFIAVNKDSNAAVDRMVRLLKEDTHYTSAYYEGERIIPFVAILSNIYERHKDATAFTERKTGDDPKDYVDLKHLGDSYYDEKRYEKAVEYYNQIPLEYFGSVRNRMAYANALYKTGRYTTAGEVMENIAKDTCFESLYFRMGNTQLFTGYPDSALAIYRDGLVCADDTLEYLDNAGSNLYAYLKYPQAAEFYRIGVLHNSESIEMLTGLGRSLQGMGYMDSAFYYFNHILETNPRSYDGLMALTILYYETGRYDSSLKVLERAEELYPENFSIHHWRGKNYSALGRSDDALGEFNAALNINPNHLGTRDLAAEELYRIGSLETALQLWSQVLSVDGNHTGALLGLAKAYDRINNRTEAYRILMKLDGMNFDFQSDTAAMRLKIKYLNEE
ncbi:MAG: tetratricopeptide repeat protein [candidate division Zixibacteria bacterium]|nr:tetratricopeptide repeat protein [candidate division Zixibacteria bacterium]